MTAYYIGGAFRCDNLNATLAPEACAKLHRAWNAENRVPRSGLINSPCTGCPIGLENSAKHPEDPARPIVYKLSNGQERPVKSFDRRKCPCGRWFQPESRNQVYHAMDCKARPHAIHQGGKGRKVKP